MSLKKRWSGRRFGSVRRILLSRMAQVASRSTKRSPDRRGWRQLAEFRRLDIQHRNQWRSYNSRAWEKCFKISHRGQLMLCLLWARSSLSKAALQDAGTVKQPMPPTRICVRTACSCTQLGHSCWQWEGHVDIFKIWINRSMFHIQIEFKNSKL